MVSASKILTVSYGTFSCTLEGFDDPFSTMRSIAEYFRDLAADDRYFGAEPPTPDADMLHRIAEREIQRKVDARVEDNNIVLRQMDSPLPEGKARVVPGEALLQEPEPTETAINALTHKAHIAPASNAADGPKDRSVAQPQEIPTEKPDAAPATLSDSSIAAKLQRIRAVVGARQGDSGIDSDNNLENGLGDDFFAASKSSEPDPSPQDLEPSPKDAEGDANLAPHIQEKPVADDDPIEETEILAQDAAILKALGAETEEAILDEVSEADDVLQIAEGYFDEPAPETKPDSSPLDDTPSQNLAETAAETDVETSILSGISAALLSDDASPEKQIQEAVVEEDENDFAEEPAPKPIAIARVVKVRRTEHAVTQRLSAEITAPKKAPISDFSSEESTLPDAEEASLLAELAEVESQAAREAKIARAGQKTEEAEPNLTAFDDGDFSGTDALDRIMAETNTKIDSDEASRKRTSIAHLRAAVHAKRAESKAGDDMSGADTSDEYRDDLARVVRPRRPVSGRAASARQLAPLVLVSEQRVDEITPVSPQKEAITVDEQAAIRPRRVRKVLPQDVQPSPSSNEDAPTDDSKESFANSFATFASQHNAKGAVEWVEAAAAFRTFANGQETFSRPQLLGLVLKTSPDSDLTRETALGAFGQLIREGMIKKIQRGRYTISENTRFRPGQERASA